MNQATLTEGYGTALLGGTAFAVLALLSALLLLPGRETAAGGGVPAPEEVHAR
ncbi:hypothetical protein [Planomonospora algeriensis]